jgi:hypothetical protein
MNALDLFIFQLTLTPIFSSLLGLDEETELHQYVLYDTEKKKGPRRINLNDDAEEKAKYAPPSSLIVHLSKIDMPELMPKTTLSSSSTSAKKRESVVDKRKSKGW